MRIALCTLDGGTYQAADFHEAADFRTMKRYLVCTECQGPAFYRGITRNGREACFGARHAEGCPLAAPEHDGTATDQGNDEDEVLTTAQRIILDFNYGTLEAPQGGQPATAPVGTGIGGTLGAGGPALRETMTRRLRSILRTLMESEDFRRSTQVIEIPEVGEFTIADFFVGFEEVTEDHIGSYRGFWGMIPDARRDGNRTLWLNSGGRENMSVLLDEGFIEETCQRFHIEEEEDFAGAYILVLGELRVGPSGKRYVQTIEPSRLTLRAAA